nr:MAG TPA: hypothetical protein [Caudoviricetes sp.]
MTSFFTEEFRRSSSKSFRRGHHFTRQNPKNFFSINT